MICESTTEPSFSFMTRKIKNKTDDYELRYLVYARKSSEDSKERQAQSIESQLNELQELAKRNRLKVVRVFTEEKSAHSTGREVFAEMIKALERGEGNAILVWHANRLTRNMTDGAVIISLMDSGAIKEIKTPGRVYTSDSMDKFVIVLEFGLSKKDSDDKSDVVKRGLKTKCEKGSQPGKAPLGYLNTPYLPGGSRYIIKDPERFDTIKRIWEMMATGNYTVSELQNYLNNELGFRTRRFKREGERPLSLSRMYKMFRDSFYYGVFEYPRGSGQFWQGTHEIMITKETFDLVQKILNRHLKTRSKVKVFDYTGTMRCRKCGCQITAEYKIKNQKNGNVHHYIYYRCTKRKGSCDNIAIKQEELETQIRQRVEKITVPPQFERWAIKYLKILYKQELQTKEILLAQNEKRKKDIEEELDRLLSFYTSSENQDRSILSSEEFIEKKKKLKNQLEYLENGATNIENKLQNGLIKSKKDFNFAVYANEWLKNGTHGEKKGLLSGLGYNLYLYNKKLDITLKKPFEILSDNHNEIIDESVRLEPVDDSDIETKTEELSSEFVDVLRGPELHRRPPGYAYHLRFSSPEHIMTYVLWFVVWTIPSSKLRMSAIRKVLYFIEGIIYLSILSSNLCAFLVPHLIENRPLFLLREKLTSNLSLKKRIQLLASSSVQYKESINSEA